VFQKKFPVKLLGTRFTNAICCFEAGPQEPNDRGISLNTHPGIGVDILTNFFRLMINFVLIFRTGYFNRDKFTEAKAAFLEGQKLDDPIYSNVSFKTWIRKCDAELDCKYRYPRNNFQDF
jgi:hypothetical protein